MTHHHIRVHPGDIFLSHKQWNRQHYHHITALLSLFFLPMLGARSFHVLLLRRYLVELLCGWENVTTTGNVSFLGELFPFRVKECLFFFVRFVSKNFFLRFVSKILNPATFDFFTSSINKHVNLSSAESTGLPRACFHGCGCCFIFIIFIILLRNPPKKEEAKKRVRMFLFSLSIKFKLLFGWTACLCCRNSRRRSIVSPALFVFRSTVNISAGKLPAAFISVNSQNTVLLGSSFLLTFF